MRVREREKERERERERKRERARERESVCAKKSGIPSRLFIIPKCFNE